MIIIGAGLAGLLAGNAFQRARIFEAGPEDQLTHKAVLRFRTDAVGAAVGIDFRPVQVHKGIWFRGKFVRPSIQLANYYSKKVTGRYVDRSIWNLEPAARYIAPENLVEQMADRCKGRISWLTPFKGPFNDEAISTMPMPVLASMLEYDKSTITFERAAIMVDRYRIQDADVFQTIYFPAPETDVYRASITGDLLIVESMCTRPLPDAYIKEIETAFGLTISHAIDRSRQQYGKIAPINDVWRRQFILNATLQHRVFSLGRFATWRNILLDDVLHDVAVIKKLVQGDAYLAARSAAPVGRTS